MYSFRIFTSKCTAIRRSDNNSQEEFYKESYIVAIYNYRIICGSKTDIKNNMYTKIIPYM